MTGSYPCINEFGDTPLICASFLGDESLVSRLLEHASFEEINQTNKYGFSALTRAAMTGSVGVAKLLLARGAQVDLPDLQNMTPLMWSTTRQHLDMMQLLLEHAANINARNHFGNTAMHEAALRGYDSAIDLLMKWRAEVDIPNNNGCTPLMQALRKRKISSAWKLLSYGADVTKHDIYHTTVLMYASIAGDPHFVSEVLRRGANPMESTIHGRTALMEAESRQNTIVSAILRNAIWSSTSKMDIQEQREQQ